MKYYILSFLLLFSFGLKAQITYTPLSAAGYQIKYLKADSGFALPVVDTGLRRNVIRPGLMVINPLDSLPYYYSGQKWKPIYVDSSGVIGLIKNKVDSVTINGSTMFYWIAGLGYGTTINKIDSVTQSGDSVFTWINGHSTYSFQLTSGSGTVTQVIGGYGLVSDTITSNGILLVDTSVIAAKSWATATFAPISHTHSASDIISGTLPIARGGTGMSGIGAVGQLIRVAASGTALEYFSPDYYNSATSIDSSSYSLNKVNGDKTVFVFDGETGSNYTASNGIELEGNNFKLQDTLDGAGTKIIWMPAKYAFRAGYVSGTQWDVANIGNYSISMGRNGTASANDAIALGTGSTATGNQDVAIQGGTASGGGGLAIGGGSKSLASSAIAIGNSTQTRFSSSTSIGFNLLNKHYGGTVIGKFNDTTDAFNPTGSSVFNKAFQVGIGWGGTGTVGEAGAYANGFEIFFTGQTRFPLYGAGTFTGTPAKQLSVDATGNLIETAQPIITSGTAAPTSTPAKVGDIYVDTTNKKLYFAAGNSSSSDWIIAN